MPLTPEDWHKRYLEQAQWTGNVRRYLLEKSNLSKAKRVLDVGIGTGALELDFISNSYQLPFGLDIDRDVLTLAKKNISTISLVQGSAQRLPFTSGIFEISFCHFLLLCVDFPGTAIVEMRRVTRSGGCVIAIAEPDYGGRIDYPDVLEQIGRWQACALKEQGADPRTGRKLLKLFHEAGLTEIEVGVIGGRWIGTSSQTESDSEWKVIEADLKTINLSPADQVLAQQLKDQDASARANGSRVLYVPTFYAWGRAP